MVCGGGEVRVCFGGEVTVEGAPKSKRSSKPELALVCDIGEFPGAESNAPNPLEELKVLLGWAAGVGVGFFASKKLPPKLVEEGDEIDGVDFWLDKLPSPAKAEGLLFWDCAGGEKLKELNASCIPPKEDWEVECECEFWVAGGDCGETNPPKAC